MALKDHDNEVLARTDPIGKALLASIEPSRKPYIVEIIYEFIEMSDPCPVYDFHIAVKPLR